MKRIILSVLLSTICIVLMLTVLPYMGAGVQAAEVITLKAVTFIPKTTNESKMVFDYWDTVEKKSNGRLKIKYLGGPEVIRSVEQVQALRTGVILIASAPGAYHAPLVKALGALGLTRNKPWEQRENGFFDLTVKLYESINLRHLGRLEAAQGFYMMTNFPVKNPRTDFKGKKIRSVATYDRFLEALGCAKTTVPRVEIYTAMERRVIDGFLSNAPLIITLGQQEVVKYIIIPALYSGPCGIQMNLDVWKKLPKDIQDVLANTAAEFERKYDPVWRKYDKEAREKLRKAGIQEITFSPKDAKWYEDLAYSTEWKDLIKADPVNGPKLKKLGGG